MTTTLDGIENPSQLQIRAQRRDHDRQAEQGLEPGIKHFAFVSVDDLACQQQQYNWLVKNVIECGTHGMLFGSPEAGKTLVLFDILYCIASGRPWRGNRVKQGAVFYLCGEGQGGLGRRAAAWRMQNGIKPDERFPFYTSVVPAQLTEELSALEVSTAIKRLCDATGETPTVIGIDTLARNFGAGNENSAQDMGVVIQNIDKKLIGDLGAGVITGHHTGHNNAERARGSISLPGALDVSYKVSKDDQNIVRVECIKAKDFNKPDPFAFKLKVHNLGYTDEDGDPVTGATVEAVDYVPVPASKNLQGMQARAYNMLCLIYAETINRLIRRGDDPIPLIDRKEWKARVIKEIVGPHAQPGQEEWRSKGKQFDTALKKLIESGVVKQRDDNTHYYPSEKDENE